MRFKVPQFLDIEDKIFGPFTFRQFVYLAGGGGICYVLFQALGFLLGLIPIIIVGSFALMLAFYRPNNKPFIDLVEASFKYLIQSKLYIWQQRKVKKIQKEKESTSEDLDIIKMKEHQEFGRSKLKDLSWSLDVLDKKE
jgi:hypothetical protein